MPLLEEVDEGVEDPSLGAAESLKAEHRRRRASKARKKKRAERTSGSGLAVFRLVVAAAVIVALGHWARIKAMSRASNGCQMTYSRPKFVPLPVAGYPGREGAGEGETAGGNPGYGYRLMRYLDAKLPASDKADPLKPRGIPVLFVPGHLGKYDQARSLGSQAAEMKISSPRRRLDVFTLDLLEEWTAMHGSLVWRQAEFLNHAVEAILDLYSDVPAVESVMVVGHSLGGLVARTAFTLPSYQAGSITDILTLGTPHERAPWGMDYSYLRLYQCTDSLWRWHSSSPSRSRFSHCYPGDGTVAAAVEEGADKAAAPHEASCLVSDDSSSDGSDADGACAASPTVAAVYSETTGLEPAGGEATNAAVGRGGSAATGVDPEGLLGNTVLLSLSGGLKDLMVHPSICIADGLGLDGQSVSFTTEVMDGCGFGVDHLALVWCKQVVARVIATLSELERLHTMGAGAKERTRVASGVLKASSSSRPSGAETNQQNSSSQFPESAGFEEATEEGGEYLMLARALASDRFMLVIPAWVYVACLVLAATLTRGLFAKSAKDGTLLPVPVLLAPQNHLQLDAIRCAWRSLWASIRARGTTVTTMFVMSCGIVCVWANGDIFAVKFLGLPSAEERMLELLSSLPGGKVGVTVLRLLSGVAIRVVRALNPFDGARDALRLDPLSGIMAVYVVSAGMMAVFVYVVTVLGVVGNGIRRMLPSARPVMPLLRSQKFAAVAASATVVAAHVDRFSLPPTFREVTLKGELSVVFTILSLSLYALLGSIILFPSHSPAVAAHQHLVVLLYAPINAMLMGPHIAAAGILSRAGGSSHDPFVAPAELAIASVALLPIIASVWLARRARPFPSPPSMHAFLAEFQALMAEEVARANGGSVGGRGVRESSGGSTAAALAAAALERPNGHGACGTCLHADGGQGAIFVETDKERVSVGGGVSLGPGFRVVACDCPRREPAAPSAWCEFCRCVCKVCGGCKEAVRATRATRSAARGRRTGAGAGAGAGGGGALADALGPAASVGIVAAVVLYVGLWAFGMRMMAAPCHSLIALAVMGAVLCGMHWGVAEDAARVRARLLPRFTMGQVCSANESTPCVRRGRRPGLIGGAREIHAGIRVADRCRTSNYPGSKNCAAQLSPGAAPTSPPADDTATADRRGLLVSGDEEDVQFLEALKGLIDGAVKLLGADKGVGTWLMSGLLRKSGMVDSFVDSMVVFVDRRIGALVEVLSPKDAACAVARRLRQHVQAHDAFTAALRIRAGRTQNPGEGVDCCGGSRPGEVGDEDGTAPGGDGDKVVEEHDVQARVLWRQWKRSGGFWPAQMPDPDDAMFDGPEGAKEFLVKLDDGTQSYLRDVSRSLLDTALPEEAEDLRAACESAAAGGASADSARSIMETANRLTQLKNGVLEPMLCQVLTQQVVGRFCRSARLWQFVLQLVRPGANLNPALSDMKHPEAFSLVARALERSESTSTSTLRMELMQGLVKMAWGTTSNRDPPSSRETNSPSAVAAGAQPGSSIFGGIRRARLGRQASAKSGSSRSLLERSDSECSRLSEVEVGSEGGESASSLAVIPRGKSGGARDIFNIPYTEELSHGLAGGEKDKFYEDLEDHALEELAKFLQSEIVEKVPLANVLLPESWIPDRVDAARAFARRPTNLMLVLSVIDASKDVFSAAGARQKRKTSRAINDDARAKPTSGAPPGSGAPDEEAPESEQPETPADGGETAEEQQGRGTAGLEVASQGTDGGLWRRRRAGARRDTAGWRVWEARRAWFFGADLGVAALHFGRSLLGQQAMELGDTILKSVSLEYCSLEGMVRDEAAGALRKCSDTAAPDLLRNIKPLSTQPILYISSQMRMLRALKKTGLDFSKSFGDGPQKKALSRRFKSYSWIFTDALIDKLVALRAKDAARSRAIDAEPATIEPLVSVRSGEQEDENKLTLGDPRWKEPYLEQRKYKRDVMREMTTGCGSSKDLLVKVVCSWLPDVLAADEAAERRAREASA
eukprot:g12638.t1